MTEHPEGETRQDRIRQWTVGVGTALLVLSLATIMVLGLIIYTSSNNHHASTMRKDTLIIALLQEVKSAQADGHSTLAEIQTLEAEVASVIEGLPPADVALGKFAQWLEICVGHDHEMGCPVPPIPTS